MVVDAITVKQSVISVINLEPNGLPADDLNDEYKKIEGSDIPFRSMGYKSLLKFIEEEFKDRVRIERQIETNEVFLYPIATGNSGHIVDLIKGQAADKNTRRKRIPISTSNKNTPNLCGQQCGQQSPNAMHYLRDNNPNWALQMSKSRENQLKIIKKFQQFGIQNELSLDDLDDQEHTDEGNQLRIQSHTNKNQFKRRPRMQTGAFQVRRSVKTGSAEERNEYISSLKKQYETGDYSDRRSAQRYQNRNNYKMSGFDRQRTNISNHEFGLVPATYEWEDVSRDIDNLALSVVDERRNIDMDPSPKELLESCFDNNGKASSSCASVIIKHVDKYSFTLDKNDAIELTYAWKELSVGDEFECTLDEMNNPLKFWLGMKKDKETKKNLSRYINTFYNRHAMKLELWDDDLDEHELFACCYEDKWYRVRAENRLQDSKVQVRFVDFGSREDVEMNTLRRLPSEFMNIPILAICCGLENVRPANQYFTTASAKYFINLTENKDLIAKVLSIDRYKSKLMVELKIKESQVDVSESLVQSGYATFRLPK